MLYGLAGWLVLHVPQLSPTYLCKGPSNLILFAAKELCRGHLVDSFCAHNIHIYTILYAVIYNSFISCYLIQFQTCVDSDFRYIKYGSVFCPTLEQKRGRWFWWTHPGREITLWPFGRCQKPSSWNISWYLLVAPGNEEASRKLHQFGTASSTENAPMQFHSPIVFLPIDKKEYWIDSRTYHTVL